MIAAGETLRAMREQKPLVHQITNYVVMNETANATLAQGALPVMAHASEEVEEMARIASSLVINIGTLSPHWVDAMLLAGVAAAARPIPVVLTRSVWARPIRTTTARAPVGVTVLRGNAGEVATLVGPGRGARSSRSEPGWSRAGALRRVSRLGDGPVDHAATASACSRSERPRAAARSAEPAACRVR
jgi:hydroxyethylthiazole kinase